MIKVGTFTKSVAAAPVSQIIGSIGFQPKALLLWTACQTATGAWNAGTIYAVGMTDGSTSRSGCEALEDNQATTDTTRRWANAALTIYSYDAVLLAEADLTSFDATGFTLAWTTNNASAYYIHYLAIGGDDLTNVKLVEWTIPATPIGNTSVGGVGFQPDLVFHLGARMAALGNDNHAFLSFGAMDAAGEQFAISNAAIDNYGASEASRGNSSIRCYSLQNVISGEDGGAQFVSMDVDGFTVNRAVVFVAAHLVASLCLKGGDYKIGVFDEPNAPGNQAIATGFQPEGVLILSTCVEDSVSKGDAAFLLGAADGTSLAAANFFYPDSQDPSQSDATSRTNAMIVAGGHAASDQDVATLASLDMAGFTITWSATTNTDHDYGYVAFDTGGVAPPAATRRYGGSMSTPFTRLKWGLWVQPDGPNTTMEYLGCHTLDDIVENKGGIKDLIRCFKADGTGWEVRGATHNPPDPITTTVTGLIEATASALEEIIEGANCPFPLYVNGKLCPPNDVFAGAERLYTLEEAEIGTITLANLAHMDEDDKSTQAFEITAWPPMLRTRAVQTDRITFTGTENLNDIASCSKPRCSGDCGDAQAVCDTLVAVADATPATADVWFSFDHGTTWAAGAADPYSGLEDLKSVVCFPIDSDTTRVIVARTAVAGAAAGVYYSDDWGANWTEVLLNTPNNYGAVYGGALFALDMYHIWIVVTNATDSRIFFSDDGGETWTLQATIAAHVLYALWFSDTNTGMCVGTTDDVYTTIDGGDTWAAANATGGGDTNYCVTENAGGGIWWIGTNAGELWYSTDHGVTWTQRAFPGDSAGAVYSIDFDAATSGFMVHSPTNATGRVYRTRNGGFTWELESATVAGELYSVIACSPNQAFSVGEVDTTALVLSTHD